MEENISNTDEYMCEDCGHTTTIQGDACPECGGKLQSFSEAMKEEVEEDELDYDPEKFNADGGESLEALREEEESEALEDYHKDAFGDEE